MASLTASDVAQRIKRPGEELTVAINRLRNWTKEGLIKPAGDAHPGTGRKKRYTESAVQDAVVLQVLADATGGGAIFLAHLVDLLKPMLQSHRSRPGVVIVISRRPGSDKFSVTPVGLTRVSEFISQSENDVHIVLNPKRIFERLHMHTGT
jgi:hypothetical protein